MCIRDRYPCARYTRAEPYDSFVPHRNVQRDFARAARDGLDAYRAMLEEKEALLSLIHISRRSVVFPPRFLALFSAYHPSGAG